MKMKRNTYTTSSSKVTPITDILIILGLIANQILLSAYMIFLHKILSFNVNSLSIVIFGGLSAVIFILPLAPLEKETWKNTTVTPTLSLQVFLIGLSGVPFQYLNLIGIKMTSPAFASAIPNLAPAIIFIISASAKLEKFSIWCNYSRLKIVGTVLCMGGAILISFLMSPISSITINKQYALGCFYLFIAYFSHSCSIVLQAAAMLHFPAPFSLCAMAKLVESIITAVVKFVMDGNLEFGGDGSISVLDAVGIAVLYGVVSSVTIGYTTWCVRKKGPVTVSIFTPVQTVSSAALSAYIFGQRLGFGCWMGMLLMFLGLYVVLWVKKKENYGVENAEDFSSNVVDPLLC